MKQLAISLTSALLLVACGGEGGSGADPDGSTMDAVVAAETPTAGRRATATVVAEATSAPTA